MLAVVVTLQYFHILYYLFGRNLQQNYKILPFQISPLAECTDVAAKLFHLSKPLLQMEKINLQIDISLQTYKTASVEEFWSKPYPEKK